MTLPLASACSCTATVPSSHALCSTRTRMRSLSFMVRSVSLSEISFQASCQTLDEQLVATFAGNDPDALVIGLMRVLHVHNYPLALAVAHHEMHEALLRVLRIENAVGVKRVAGRRRIGADKIPELARQIPQRLQFVRVGLRSFEEN